MAKYHKQLLTLDGPSGLSPGKWTVARVGTAAERMSLRAEIETLEERLEEVGEWKRRVRELEELLSVHESV